MSDINMTPLIDVMLVLLVIFIITVPMMTSTVRLDLPKTSATAVGHAPQAIAVMVDATGQFYLHDAPVSPAELARRLTAASHANPDTEVQLRADQSVPYGRIVEVMDVAQQAGLQRIGFVATATAAAPALATAVKP